MKKDSGIKTKFLITLPSFALAKGFNHPTILVYAKDEFEAARVARHLRPHANIGSVIKVNY